VVISGSCFCGEVTYAVTAPLQNARSCHCSRCRKVFGGAASAYAEVAPGSFSWRTGTGNLKQYNADPDWGLIFCAKCGSALAGMLANEVHGVVLGTVDGDPGIEIGMHIHVASKAPWDHIGGDAPQFPEGPMDENAG
jgi:hypothetical protein